MPPGRQGKGDGALGGNSAGVVSLSGGDRVRNNFTCGVRSDRLHRHVRFRMRQRRLSERQVVSTLELLDRVFPGQTGRLVAERDTDVGNVLRVVFEELADGAGYVWTAVRRGGERR